MSPELPLEIWRDRLENEIKGLNRLNVIDEKSIKRADDTIELMLNIKALGFEYKTNSNVIDLVPKWNHRVFIKINRTFPYPGGIDFAWTSGIFHPNIHPLELASASTGTGYICLNLLKKWSRLSDLGTTIKALKLLIENPNPDDPLNYPICLEAAQFFKQNSMDDLKIKFGIKDNDDKDDSDDIIVIDD
jgi:ubiquitin-protein ligase